MVNAARAYAHSSVPHRSAEAGRARHLSHIAKLARSRIYSRPCRGFADGHPEWRETASQGKTTPPWIDKLDISRMELRRTLFRNSTGKEYEIGIWALGDHQNRPLLDEISSCLLPNLQLALKQQRMPVSVSAIKAAMIVSGRLPLYKAVHQSLNESFEFHACVASYPKEEMEEAYQAFKQQVQRKTEQIEEGIQLDVQKENRWDAVSQLRSQNEDLATASEEITVTETEEEQFPDPPRFSVPKYLQKAVKINKLIFKHRAGSLYEVGVWVYSEKNALLNMQELLRENSPLDTAKKQLSQTLAKELSAALELQHKPYSSLADHAADKVAGRFALHEDVCQTSHGELILDAFVCRQPAKEVEEVQQAFEKQIEEAISKVKAPRYPALRMERYLIYHHVGGSAPEHLKEGRMLWKDRITETERLLLLSEEGSRYKRDLKWLMDWEREARIP